MNTFYDHLLEEKKQLDERREKVDELLSSDKLKLVDPFQLSLLNIQSKAMTTYSQVLNERILWLKRLKTVWRDNP